MRNMKNSLKLFLICGVVLLCAKRSFGQKTVVDSLLNCIKKAGTDSARVRIYIELSDVCEESDILKYTEPAIRIAEKNLSDPGIDPLSKKAFQLCLADAWANTGYFIHEKGELGRSLSYHLKSLKLRQDIGDKKGLANSLNSIGLIYGERGDVKTELDYFGRSLKIQEEIGDKEGAANSLSNIGVICLNQGDTLKSLEYTLRSLKIQEAIGDKEGVATSLNNIANIYHGQGKIDEAMENYFRAVKIQKEIGDRGGEATTYNNIGFTYEYYGGKANGGPDYAKALEYYGKSLTIREELGEKEGIAFSLHNIGSVYLEQKKYASALPYCMRSLKVSQEIGFPENIRNAADQLKLIYQEQGNYEKALEMYELHIQMRDSILNHETKKASLKQQLKYEYEKKAAADSVENAGRQKVKDAQLNAQAASLKQEKTQRYALYTGLVLVAGFLGFVFNRFRVTQRQKKIIEAQKQQVDEAFRHLEEKNKEVIDSIYYARRIQRALITPESYIAKKLNELRNGRHD